MFDFDATRAPKGDQDLLPSAKVDGRLGLTDRLDLGVAFGGFLQLESKIRLTQAALPGVVSIAPTVAAGPNEDAALGLVEASLPLLVGMRFGHGSELVLGLKATGLRYRYLAGLRPPDCDSLRRTCDVYAPHTAMILLGGLSMGLSLAIGNSPWRVFPEFGVLAPIAARSDEPGRSSFMLKPLASFVMGISYRRQ